MRMSIFAHLSQLRFVVSYLSRLRPRGYLEHSEYKIDAEEERAEKRKRREAVPHQQLQTQD